MYMAALILLINHGGFCTHNKELHICHKNILEATNQKWSVYVIFI